MRLDVLIPTLLSFGCSLFIIALLFGGFHLLDTAYPAVFPSTLWAVLGGIVVTGTALILCKREHKRISINLEGFALGLLVYLISDIPFRRYNYFQTAYVRPELAAGLIAGYFLVKRWGSRITPVLFLISIAAGVTGFFLASHGRLIFSDDHPSFLFRLMQLKENFPYIPFYSTQWNGGYEAREFFPSGVLNVFAVFWPLVYLFDITSFYNTLVVLLFFGIFPAAFFLSTRIAGFSRDIALTAATLFILSSLLWFRWFFSYGTLGFLTSIVALTVFLSILGKVLSDEPWRARDNVIFFISTTLMLFWPLSVLVAAPLLFIAAFNLRRISRKPGLMVVLCLLAVVHIPWMILFADASQVFDFVSSAQSGKAIHADTNAFSMQAFQDSYGDLRLLARGANPLLLFFSLPGLLLMGRSIFRRLFCVELLWLFFLAAMIDPVKPQLELNRMYTVFNALLSLPAGLALSSVLSKLKQSKRIDMSSALFLVPLSTALFIPFRIFNFVSNGSGERYHFAWQTVNKLNSEISSCANGGRVIFAGFTLHELSGGHVAPLPTFTGTPLIAKSYQHDTWTYTDVIPEYYRKRGEMGILEFLNIYNVGCVLVHDKGWLAGIRGLSEDFTPSSSIARFHSFIVNGFQSNYFLEGRGGALRQSSSAISLVPETPSIILKFNYFDFLESTHCRIEPKILESGLRLIALYDCPLGEEVTIKAIPPIARILRTIKRIL